MNRSQHANRSKRTADLLHRRRSAWLGVLVALTGAGALVPVACSTNAEPRDFDDDPTTGSTSSGMGGSAGGGGGDIFDGGLTQPIAITPINPILKLEIPLAGQSVQFTCNDTGTEMPVDAAFTLSNLEVGTITPTGLFTPNGERTGETIVRCEHNGSKSETTIRVLIHAVDNQGGLNQQTIDVLKGPPGQSDVSWQFVYPYDNTVFPRGILAPEIHLKQGSFPGTGFYVEIAAKEIHYEGFFNTSGFNTQLQMSQEAWKALSNSAAGETLEVRISKVYNNQKYGPIFRRWIIANGKLHGSIYYNTYDSPLAGNDGAMMRIKGNSPTPDVLVGGCTVCHSVSSDGSTAAAANHSGPGGIFDLTGGNLNPPLIWQDSERAAFAGIYPKNGEVFVVNGAPGGSWPPNTPGTSNTWLSELRSKNGTIIPNSGIEQYYAMTPVFSHDGTMIAFNDRGSSPPYPSTLALMKYDAATQKFSDYQVLAIPKSGQHVSWPAFTPDGKYVVYQEGIGDDLATWSGNTGRIFAVDVQTKEIKYLTNLNGDGYVPAGARDENKNYEPTIAPIVSGGYIWITFTSRRTYGNKLTDSEYATKRLWVSAFSLNSADPDPSHPAFYIAGQELTSGNSRGFWTLDACKQDGKGCETGDECCNGFCNPVGEPPMLVCSPPDGSCADEFEACKTSSDCCEASQVCVNGSCTYVPQ
jgi:hypothetical protein